MYGIYQLLSFIPYGEEDLTWIVIAIVLYPPRGNGSVVYEDLLTFIPYGEILCTVFISYCPSSPTGKKILSGLS